MPEDDNISLFNYHVYNFRCFGPFIVSRVPNINSVMLNPEGSVNIGIKKASILHNEKVSIHSYEWKGSAGL